MIAADNSTLHSQPEKDRTIGDPHLLAAPRRAYHPPAINCGGCLASANELDRLMRVQAEDVDSQPLGPVPSVQHRPQRPDRAQVRTLAMAACARAVMAAQSPARISDARRQPRAADARNIGQRQPVREVVGAYPRPSGKSAPAERDQRARARRESRLPARPERTSPRRSRGPAPPSARRRSAHPG